MRKTSTDHHSIRKTHIYDVMHDAKWPQVSLNFKWRSRNRPLEIENCSYTELQQKMDRDLMLITEVDMWLQKYAMTSQANVLHCL